MVNDINEIEEGESNLNDEKIDLGRTKEFKLIDRQMINVEELADIAKAFELAINTLLTDHNIPDTRTTEQKIKSYLFDIEILEEEIAEKMNDIHDLRENIYKLKSGNMK